MKTDKFVAVILMKSIKMKNAQICFKKFLKIEFVLAWNFKISNIEARKFHFPKYKKFFGVDSFLFFKLGKLLPEI